MILSDVNIKRELTSGNIVCTPLVEENISNSSLDLRLGSLSFLDVDNDENGNQIIDFEIDENGKLKTKNVKIKEIDLDENGFILLPNQFILGSTLEYVGNPCNHIISEVKDKSTLARCGLSVCFSAGYIDAGNALNITLEIKNHSAYPIVLYKGMHICQIVFKYLNTPCEKLYNGKYLNDKGTVAGK